ncbi:MAG: hypothetical protein II908_07700 [Bacteroidaceae bacterium]|nr:hypothetical protein [Bacteroidaceae bacterium]
MKNIILFLICLVVNITASSQVRVVFDGTSYGWTGRDSVIIKKQIDKIKNKWKNSNSLVGKDSIRIIISNADVAVVPMYFLADYQMIEGRSIVKLLKKEKCPFFSVTFFYNGAFLGTCKYDPIKKKYRIACSSTIHDVSLHTDYYEIRGRNGMDLLSSKNIFAITTGCKYFKFEENLFCLHYGVLYLVDYDDFSKMSVVDNSFFE